MERPRILLIDDDEALTRTLGRALKVMGGFEIRTEHDGRRAIDVAREFRPHLILLDVVAEEWDGGVVAGAIEAVPDLADIRIAFMSGLVDDDPEHRTDSRGRPLIPKGIAPSELVPVLRRILGGEID